MNQIQPEIKRILAVGAHPDDIEILAGGTLAKYAQAGCQVVMGVATDGSAGHMLIPPKELAEIRHAETQQSAAIIGAELHWLGFGDELVFEDIATRMRFVDLIRDAKPDVILTHNPQDYHPDHRVVSRTLFDASFVSSLPNIHTNFPPHLLVPPLVYFDSFGNGNFQPTDFVDIEATFKTKKAMLECHVSQLRWLKDHDNIDIVDIIYVMARSRGTQCGASMAEGFGLERSWPRLRTYRVLP